MDDQEDASPKPFSIQTVLVLSGGHLGKKKLQLECETIENLDFFCLSKSNRGLATALGAEGSAAQPFQEHSLLDYMKKHRNDAVDELIKTARRSADPLADSDALGNQAPIEKDRAKLFHEAQVPHVIDLHFQEFVTGSGKRVPPTTIKVISTPKRHCLVSMEGSCANFEWLLHALQHSWGDRSEPTSSSPGKRRLEQEMEELNHVLPECVKMKVQDNDQVSLWVNYKSEDNNYRKVRKTIRRHLYTDFDGFKLGVQTLGCHLQKMCYSKLQGEGEDDADGHHD